MDFSFQRNSQKWFFKKMIKFLNTFFFQINCQKRMKFLESIFSHI